MTIMSDKDGNECNSLMLYFFILQIMRFLEKCRMEYPKIKIESIESSNPSKGRNVSPAALMPNIENNPIPQAIQLGAKIPKNIPIEAKILNFLLELLLRFLVL